MKKYIYFLIATITLISCNDYLDIQPKGTLIPETIEDYDLLLNPIYTLEIDQEVYFTSDDFSSDGNSNYIYTYAGDPDDEKVHLYKFAQRYKNRDDQCWSWNRLYEDLYPLNKVINEIDNASMSVIGYKESDKKVIKAEAKFLRAVRYLFLVNIFAKHYDSNAASTPAIPLVVKSDIAQESPKQATVKEVYDLIISDLKEGLSYLPEVRKEVHRPNKAAAYAMLARTYLYQGEYDLAMENAELALKKFSTLIDYTSGAIIKYNVKDFYPNEQYVLALFDGSGGHYYGGISDELTNLFEAEDMRGTVLLGCKVDWKKDANGYWQQVEDCSKREHTYYFNLNPLPSVGEMYITLAECYARKGKNTEALNKLNELRRTRIKNVTDKSMSDFSNNDELLKFVLEERRREVSLTGTRLFDLKRLNLDPRFQKTVVHKFTLKNGTVEEYKAEPNSGKLVIPIPENVKRYNENLQ